MRLTRELTRFLRIALASASEVRYLLGLTCRLELLPTATSRPLETHYDELVRALQALLTAIETTSSRSG